MNAHSPPLPNLHALSIDTPHGPGGYNHPPQNNYRYNGVFGPPAGMPQPAGSPDWSSGGKRSSRSGLPTNWYDPNEYRPASPPATLSPPSSVPTTASSNHHQASAYPYHPQPSYPDGSFGMPLGMVDTPSPPPMGYPPMGFNGGYPVDQRRAQQQQAQGQANGWRNGYAMPAIPHQDDDVIPTAIVIKNIPFAVTRETLLGVMESLGAPLPYAFNYHHDNGVFRGLAFANFRAPEEAASVVAALNGYDVQGRKLRVEYKKVLQPGEKDKIEREKALKRMRSLQFDREKMPPPLNLPIRHQQVPPIPYDQSPPHSASAASTSSADNLPPLDMNDPATLDIYSRVLVFKEDRMRDELAFSKNLTPQERRIVHSVAQRLGLSSRTRGEDDQTVVVSREPQPRPQLHSSTSLQNNYYDPSPQSSAPEVSPNLRYKKSMPDLRGFNGPVVSRDPSRSLTPQRSSGNFRETGREYASMGAVGGRQASRQQPSNPQYGGAFNGLFGNPIDIPPVPPLPSGMVGMHNKGHSVSSISGVSGQPYHSHSHSFSQQSNQAFSSHHSNGRASPEDLLSPISSSSLSHAQSLPNNNNATQPLRNPRGPAGESRGFSQTLRPVASRGMMGPPHLPHSSGSAGSSSNSASASAAGAGLSSSLPRDLGREAAGTIGEGPGSVSSGRDSGSVKSGSGDEGIMRTRESLEI
ncbi:hypothetical protein L202_06186 [Cryptococcus amylolentus CBS 6039]|uniref:RRM domain-containing protein n=2 Tax=Cryptococcus amylolentus TaxID=104669 RepID=A0A1E3HIR9_9TREE|nr:hypothetical protein L202_06186 [Cryptococcus amylolentus CBS 6039]ODN76257.1 hypothetical protein L202_06186 [Cryptococcus amylolentus CBS 6039]ODN96268.1 hypothetical protein I350_08276 [Cryptococcus amylolentus CBS 6273]